MSLIPNWRAAWRFASVQAAALLALLSFLQVTVLPLYQFAIPADVWPWVTAGFGTAIGVLRVLSQPALHADEAAAADEGANP